MFKRLKKEMVYLCCKGVVRLYKFYLIRGDRAVNVYKVTKMLNPLYRKMDKAKDQRLRKLSREALDLQLGYLVYHIPKTLKKIEQLEYERFIKMRWCE